MFGRPFVIIITSRITHFHHTRLNVVVGPNGTGKSTILCAICLGLGGQPPLLGRADDARLFIKHEKDEATVEIELAPLEGKPVHVFKRVIDRAKGSESGKGAGEFMCLLCGCKDASSQNTSMPGNHFHPQDIFQQY